MNKIAKELAKIAKELLTATKSAKFNIKDLVWLNGNKRTTFRIEKVNKYEVQSSVFYTYDLVNLRNHKVSNSVNENELMAIGSPIVDKEGRDAVTAANEIFKNKEVVVGFNRTVSETYGKITDINPKGIITVQTYIPGEAVDIEHFKVDDSNKSDVIKFKPMLFIGEWRWTGEGQTLDVYKGGTLTRLLD